MSVDERPPIDERETLLAVRRWYPERADPDFDEESVDEIIHDSRGAQFVGWHPGPPESDTELARFELTSVEEDGEEVEYTVELSASLLKDAVDAHPDL